MASREVERHGERGAIQDFSNRATVVADDLATARGDDRVRPASLRTGGGCGWIALREGYLLGALHLIRIQLESPPRIGRGNFLLAAIGFDNSQSDIVTADAVDPPRVGYDTARSHRARGRCFSKGSVLELDRETIERERPGNSGGDCDQ